ncbi:MAG: hypothetical protein AAFY60_09250 [Myxococcota bacterium]
MRTYSFVLVLGALLGAAACGDGGSEPLPVEGRYRGSWQWSLGTGPISLEVDALETESYPVRFYETRDFVPGFNEDGVTPDALGEMTLNGTDAQLTLRLRTDSPPCIGDYGGPGTHDPLEGILRFEIQVVQDCAQDGPATLTFRRIDE